MNLKAGRPEKPIDEQLFWKLVEIPFATKDNVANALDVSPDTLLRWVQDKYDVDFATIKAQKMDHLKLKLAGKQYEEAMGGNTGMLIWLGKQWLEQADKIEQKQQIESRQIVEYVTDWAQPTREIDEAIAQTLPAPQKTDGDPSGSKPI